MSTGTEQQVIRLVERFQATVASDGFEGFFHAGAGDFTQPTLNALLVLKAIHAAALLRQAMWVFEGCAPPPDQGARREALNQIGENGRTVLRRLDRSFYRCNDELTRSLARYSLSLDERYCVA